LELSTENTSPGPWSPLKQTGASAINGFLSLPSLSLYRDRPCRFIVRQITDQQARSQAIPPICLKDPVTYQQFELFADQEIWLSGASRSTLVCPAGFLESPLHLGLHCPSLRHASVCEKMAPYGIAGNPAARSMKMLIEKNICGPDILVTEASYRCEKVEVDEGGRTLRWVVYPEDYNLDLCTLHQGFADWIWDSSQARVVLLTGSANHNRFEHRFGRRAKLFFPFPQFPGTSKAQPSFLLLNDDEEVRQTVICIHHPERMSRWPEFLVACLQDAYINLAVVLSGARCTINLNSLCQYAKSFLLVQCASPLHVPLVYCVIHLMLKEIYTRPFRTEFPERITCICRTLGFSSGGSRNTHFSYFLLTSCQLQPRGRDALSAERRQQTHLISSLVIAELTGMNFTQNPLGS